MTETYQLPRGQKLKRILLRALVKTVMSILFRIRITGKENIPVGTAYMIAANHVSHFEPPLILAFWPEYPEAVAGHDVWERGINGKFVSTYGAIPVKRGEYDRKVLEEMIKILRSGRSLMISPEGGRSHTPGMRRALPGVAYVVNKTHVPVLPVAIVGTRNDSLRKSLRLGRPVLEMRIGKPFMLPEISGKGEERRAARQQAADEVMLRIASMLPEEYHGVYTGQVENFPDD